MMKPSLVVAFVASVSFAGLGCGANKPGSASIPNPIGPINTGGAPDVGKTNGEASLGGKPNAGGAPDVGKTNTGGKPDPKKTNGKASLGGETNTGGAPDVSKSVPKGSSKK